MIRILLTFLLFAVMAVPFGARADVFYVESLKGKFSASFPDNWRVVNNQKPDDVLTVRLPGEEYGAVCRVRSQADSRYSMYPVRYSEAVRNVHFTDQFWADYLMEYDYPELLGVNRDAGLGRGFASHAEARYVSDDADHMHKQGLMFVSLYGDRLYVVDCSAREEYFPRFKKAFLSFVKSVDFNKVDQELPRGNYRDFVGSPLEISGPKNIANGRY